MKISVITLFSKMIEGFLCESIISRAQNNGKVEIDLINLRNYGLGRHKQVDDTPYGGGAGMVLRVDVLKKAIDDTKKSNPKAKVILLTPQGEKYNQKIANNLSGQDIILICGHYEGFDERIRHYVDQEISIGDYVMTGGEIAAAAIIDSAVRLIPGVLGREESHQDDSFQNGFLEYPHYTRPEEFNGKRVPEVLKSGNHEKIEEWRKEQSEKRTKERRPDLHE